MSKVKITENWIFNHSCVPQEGSEEAKKVAFTMEYVDDQGDLKQDIEEALDNGRNVFLKEIPFEYSVMFTSRTPSIKDNRYFYDVEYEEQRTMLSVPQIVHEQLQKILKEMPQKVTLRRPDGKLEF